jgi:UDP-N-acetylglucosamine 2-epimerase (non-hydrolysing)
MPIKKNSHKIAVLIGTRPGIVKMSVVYHAACEASVTPVLIHSGQHYSAFMDQEIMNDMELPDPDHRFLRPDDCISHASQTAFMLVNLEQALLESKPDVLLVCGDANTNLAGALAARKLEISVGHVEAGLRSYDWRMPEEHNRRMIDHISDLLFAPTQKAVNILKNENVTGEVFCVGNTVADAALKFRPQKTTSRNRGVLTMHREENVDSPEILRFLLEEIGKIAKTSRTKIDFLMHPRTRKRIEENGLWQAIPNDVEVKKTVGYREMLDTISNSEFVLTDSGGLQEEACILGTPCYTLRMSTERPETVDCGANIVLGVERPYDIFCDNWPFPNHEWESPFGNGTASKQIVDLTIDWLNREKA